MKYIKATWFIPCYAMAHTLILPKFFVISVPDEITFTVTKTISISVADGVIKHYSLSELIYYGQAHFVSRFIDKFNNVRFHDGMLNGGQSQLEGEISSYTEEDLGTCGNKSWLLLYTFQCKRAKIILK